MLIAIVHPHSPATRQTNAPVPPVRPAARPQPSVHPPDPAVPATRPPAHKLLSQPASEHRPPVRPHRLALVSTLTPIPASTDLAR